MDVNYQIGGLAGTALAMVVLFKLVNWIIRKIRHRPKMPFRDWLTSWWAGPELFFIGSLFEFSTRSDEDLSMLLVLAVQCTGLAIFIVKVIASIASRFRRRASVSPPVSPAGQPLGRQPPLG
jgi:hypothetical protein